MNAPPPITEKDRVIAEVFYNKEGGFGSIADTYKRTHALDPRIRLADVRAFLAKQEIRQRRKPIKVNSFVADLPREEFQIDLADFGEKAIPRYCLVAIDIFTKEAAGVPIANKVASSTAAALEKVFEQLGFPVTILCDEGGEFHSEFARTAKNEGVDIIYSRTGGRFVERFIRTLKMNLFERRKVHGGVWSQYLDNVITQYNNRIHSSHNAKPSTVDEHEYDFLIIHNIWEQLERKAKFPVKHAKIDVDDHVKIRIKPKSAGYKETFSSWSEAVYTVNRIDHDVEGGDRYHLQGYHRPLLRFEVLRVKDVQRHVAGELQSALFRVQRPQIAPAQAAAALATSPRSKQLVARRPQTRSSTNNLMTSAAPQSTATFQPSSGSGLTNAERAAVPAQLLPSTPSRPMTRSMTKKNQL